MPSLASVDPYEHLHISLNPDGSLTRNHPFVFAPAGLDATAGRVGPVLSKDVPLNAALGTSIRVFVPQQNQEPDATTAKLPVILYFHAGGFIFCSPAVSPIHDLTARMAAGLPAVVLSVDHRLAPEHRLPAAYDDALDAFLWVRDRAAGDPWLAARADFSRCFIMGSSSGGNIAFHLALRALALDLGHVRIAGVAMDQPFFGGEERTGSEVRMADDKVVPLAATDLMWELALPAGANRDHEYSKPTAKLIKGMRMPRCWVRGCVGDPMVDRMRAVAAMLEREGARVVALLSEEGSHGMEMVDATKAEAMVDDLRGFVYDEVEVDGENEVINV